MNIYISKDPKGEPTALILAADQSYAEVAFEAMGTPCHSVEEIDPNSVIDWTHSDRKVFYLMTSIPIDIQRGSGMGRHTETIYKFKRGKS